MDRSSHDRFARASFHDGDPSMRGGRPLSSGLVVSGAVTALTLGVAFGLLALDVEYFWVAFPVGFGIVLPTALGVALRSRGQRADRGASATSEHGAADATRDDADALDALRLQYARGELSDEEFDRRADRLVASEE